MKNSIIAGVGHYVPETVVKNSDLEKVMDTTNEWIIERTGIEERRYGIKHEETSTTMGAKAAEMAIENAGIKLMEAGTSHWIQSDVSVTNESGFTGLPGGRIFADGPSMVFFSGIGDSGFWCRHRDGRDPQDFRPLLHDEESRERHRALDGLPHHPRGGAGSFLPPARTRRPSLRAGSAATSRAIAGD